MDGRGGSGLIERRLRLVEELTLSVTPFAFDEQAHPFACVF